MAVHESGSPDDIEALELAIALSQRSNHPVSRALTALDGLLDQGEGSVSKRITDFRAVPGTLQDPTCAPSEPWSVLCMRVAR